MITLTPKRQLGVRVRSDVADELRRIAAAREMSVNELTEQIIVGHLMAIQRGETMNLDEFTVKVDELISEHTAKVDRLVREALKDIVTRILRNIDAVKGMIDAIVCTLSPAQHEKYVAEVRKILRAMGLQTAEPPLQ